jgi:MFS family permease
MRRLDINQGGRGARHVTLAPAPDAWIVGSGAALWGLHRGATQGIMTAIVADMAPDELRGTAFGVFNLITGVALLAPSVIAGGLWTLFGPALTFYVAAVFATIALAGLLTTTRHMAVTAAVIATAPCDACVTSKILFKIQ